MAARMQLQMWFWCNNLIATGRRVLKDAFVDQHHDCAFSSFLRSRQLTQQQPLCYAEEETIDSGDSGDSRNRKSAIGAGKLPGELFLEVVFSLRRGSRRQLETGIMIIIITW